MMRSDSNRISGSSEETTTTARSIGGQLVDQRVDLVLGLDVDAARRFIQQQHLRSGRQPFAEDHLLLVAAAQVADRLTEATSS